MLEILVLLCQKLTVKPSILLSLQIQKPNPGPVQLENQESRFLSNRSAPHSSNTELLDLKSACQIPRIAVAGN